MSATMARASRQSAILEVLRSHSVQTQAQLAEELQRRRINATQATISRDLRQLRVARVSSVGGPRYLPPAELPDVEARLVSALTSQLTNLEVVGSIVVLRTLSGGAQVVAAAVDALSLEQAAGSLAGDDTVFLLARSGAGARAVARRLRETQQRGAQWG
ncbi:MAG TPA: arginine repressor [Candidatus Dormibacteraeota bacterium]|nr:arginine repressor [Candidatus Dormibacteraeota bacterium]